MQSIDYLERARSRYTDQHSEDPVFDRIVHSMIYQAINNQDIFVELEDTFLDIDKSSGSFLDLIGYMVGQDRLIKGADDGEYFGFYQDFSALGFGSLEDDEMGGYWYSLMGNSRYNNIVLAKDDLYRRLIKARIIFNNNLATPETLLRILNQLTNTTTSYFKEDGEGHISIYIESDPDGLVTHFLSLMSTERNLIPIPLGVGVSLNITGN